MDLIVDQQSKGYKHFCKICKKGFMCGRALGGHMRAHGISDYSSPLDDDDPASDWYDSKPSLYLAGGDNAASGNKRMYALRTNPNRLKSCRSCQNCGKEFSSWKSFLEHGKCSASDDRDDSLVSSRGYSDDDEGEEEEEEEYYDHEGDNDDRQGCRWSKRKRSMRVQVDNFNSICPSSEEEDLANCLMMLSNGTVDNPVMAKPEESCASASRDDDHRRPSISIAPLAYMSPTMLDKAKESANNNNKGKGGLFECKACKKVFNSHQALGGHRASHKKVKGCFAARTEQAYDYANDDDVLTNDEFFPTKSMSTLHFDHGPSSVVASSSKRKSKVHECSICHRVFSSGQALGGHKRCHWITSNGSADAPSLTKLSSFQEHLEQIQRQQQPSFIKEVDPLTLKLNLNLLAPPTDARHFEKVVATEMYLRSWLGLETKEIREHNNLSQKNECDIRVKNKDNRMDIANNCAPMRNNNHSNNNGLINMVNDVADSKVKLAKLSELNDMMIGGSSSSWLQVGIGPTAADEAVAASAK